MNDLLNEQLTQVYGYLHGMWRFRWSALVITWIFVIIGATVVFSLPDKFNVIATVYVDTSSVMKPLLKGLAPEADTRDELAVMNRVLLSRENLLSVMRETDMDLEIHNDKEKEDMLDKLKSSIRLRGGSSGRGWNNRKNIYELSYTGTDSERAYQIVSSLLNTMIEDTLSTSRTDTVSAQKFLDTQINEYERRLSAAEQRLADFKKENVGFMPDEKGNYYARLQRAQDAVEMTRSELKLAEQRYAELNKQLRGEKPLIDSRNYTTGYISKLRAYEEELRQLLNTFTDMHPDVIALKQKIENLKATGDLSTEDYLDTSDDSSTLEFNPVYQEMKVEANKAGVEVSALRTELAEHEKVVARLKGSIDIIPQVEAELTRLNRDYEITRKRYLALVERRESARLAQSAGQSTSNVKFRVIDHPVVPTRPSGPPRLLYLAAVLVLAFGAGLAWSLLRFLLEPTYFELKQVTEKTGLPLLGTVSLYLSPRHLRRRRLQLASFLTATTLLVIVYGGTMIFHQQVSAVVADAVSELNQKLRS